MRKITLGIYRYDSFQQNSELRKRESVPTIGTKDQSRYLAIQYQVPTQKSADNFLTYGALGIFMSGKIGIKLPTAYRAKNTTLISIFVRCRRFEILTTGCPVVMADGTAYVARANCNSTGLSDPFTAHANATNVLSIYR